MADKKYFTKLNGYFVKDEEARADIEKAQTDIEDLKESGDGLQLYRHKFNMDPSNLTAVYLEIISSKPSYSLSSMERYIVDDTIAATVYVDEYDPYRSSPLYIEVYRDDDYDIRIKISYTDFFGDTESLSAKITAANYSVSKL